MHILEVLLTIVILQNIYSFYFEKNNFNYKKMYCNLDEYIEFEKQPHIYNPKYTIIWHDCVSCRKLLSDLNKLLVNWEFIDNGYIEEEKENFCKTITQPLLFRENNYIGRDVFQLYLELM